MSEEGQVLDSFIAVEIGLSDYEACWDAHNDVYESLDESPEEEMVLTLFLTEMCAMLDVEDSSLEKVIATNT